MATSVVAKQQVLVIRMLPWSYKTSLIYLTSLGELVNWHTFRKTKGTSRACRSKIVSLNSLK